MKEHTKSVLNTDSYDRRRFGQILDMSDKLKTVGKEGKKLFPSFQPLMGDMWAGLFKMKPELLEEVPQELEMNYKFMEKIIEDESYQEFREYTRLDDLASAIGITKYSETVMKWVKEQSEKDQELADNLKRARSRDKQGLQQVMQALSDALSQNGNSLTQMLKQAAQETMDVKDGVKSLLNGFQAGTGELKNVPLKDQITLAEKLSHNKKLQEIAKWAGRMKVIAQRKQRSKHKEAIDRSGVRQGNTIEQLLPVELATYASPLTKMDFMRRYVEGQTLQYDTKGKEQLGKGPIVLCLDQSGSMRDQDNVSKGFALALMSIARKQRRDFAIIPFSYSATEPIIYEKGKSTVQDMLKLATTFLDGGTDFQSPLSKAATVIRKSRFDKADIIFVTDGDASLSSSFVSDWQQLKEKRGFRVLSLILGRETDETVKLFSDQVVRVSSFTDESISQAFDI
jgi:uncharacterized protein with von Willebrand factor type A (vWA) domain